MFTPKILKLWTALLLIFGLTIQAQAAPIFNGSYNSTFYYDLNISDGVVVENTPGNINITPGTTTDLNAELTIDTNTATLPLNVFGSMARVPYQNYDYGSGCIVIDSMLLSDGNNMSFAMTANEYSDPSDISFQVSVWQKSLFTPTIDDLVGDWQFSYYSDLDLGPRNTVGFSDAGTLVGSITKVDDSSVLLSIMGQLLTLQVDGNRAYLIGPTSTATAFAHAFEILHNGTGLSFFSIQSELYDPNDVSLTIGLGSKATPVPEPGTLLLLGSGITGLAGLRRWKGRR